MRLRTFLSLLIVFCAPALIAQTLTLGNVYVPSTGWAVGPVNGKTYIDLVRPASANGLVTHIGFAFPMWADQCPGAAKVKFFRRNGDLLTMIAERGPFDKSWAPDTDLYPLAPPVQLLAGDLIGLVQTNDSCGGGLLLAPAHEGHYLAYSTDVVGTVRVSEATTATGTLNAWGVGDARGELRIIPVVGSADGEYGSQWKTSVQLLNPHSVATTGQLLFRPERATEIGAYTSMPYSLDPGATQTILDIGAVFGIKGLGSLDVMMNAGSVPPVVVAHIQHPNGGGAVGATEESIDPNDFGNRVLYAGVTGFLIAPHSAAASRFNIGVRTLESGATITATLQTSSGAALQTVTKEFPANYFEQFSPTELFGLSLTGGESIAVTLVKGSAIVYGSATDNVTNDPSIQHVVGFVPVNAQ